MNEKINVDRKYIRLLRAIQHDIKVNGIEESTKRYYKREVVDWRHIQWFQDSLAAKLKYVEEIKRAN